jgi:toxin CcdB
LTVNQFDVCKLRGGEIVVILQHDTFSDFRTRMVAPLVARTAKNLATTLNPHLRFSRKDWVLATHLMAAVKMSAMTDRLGTLAAEEFKIKRAIDQLFLGV